MLRIFRSFCSGFQKRLHDAESLVLFQNGLLEDVNRRCAGEVHHYRNAIYTQKPNYVKDLLTDLREGKRTLTRLYATLFGEQSVPFWQRFAPRILFVCSTVI